MNMKEDLLKSRLQDYVARAHLWHYLDGDYPKEDLNGLLIKQHDIELEILSEYGLPHTYYYSEFFQFLGLRKPFKLGSLNSFIKKLKYEAEKYHSQKAISDLALLELAQAVQLDIEEVLPELTLRLLPEPYYTYLYFAQLLTKEASAEDILQELKIIQKHDLSLKLCLLSKDKKLLKTAEFQVLLNSNLKFLDAFLSEFETTFDFTGFINLHHPL